MTASNIIVLPLNDPRRTPVNIIVIPDFAKDGTRSQDSQGWINSMMPPDGAQAQIFHFEYRIALNGPSMWHQLSEKGVDLLRTFRQEAGRFQALSILSDPASSTEPALQVPSKHVLNIIAGVLFFGTPHTKIKEPNKWSRLTRLLNFAARLPKRFLAQSEADANAAAIICEDFEQSGLEAPVLSIYETKPTKIRSARWLLRDTCMLIDKPLAETWAKKEKLLGNDVSHEAVASFSPGSAIHQEIGLLLMSAFSMPRLNMTVNAMEGINPADHMELWEDSISQVSRLRIQPDDTTSAIRNPSEGATHGSSLPSNFDIIPSNDMADYVEAVPESDRWPCYLWEGLEEQRNFVGRDQTFKAIDECFFPLESSSGTFSPATSVNLPCCCISGLGGIGKTQTAIQYAMARREKFDAIFVIKADNSAKLSETFNKISLALGLAHGGETGEKPSEEADLVVNRNKAMQWLTSPKFSVLSLSQRTKVIAEAASRRLNWLIIFDNVENSSILRDYWPVGNVGCILVTTRDARTSNYLRSQGTVVHIYLDRLDTSFASQLLLQLSYIEQSESNKGDASAIVNKLGGHPLAIEQVAAYIDRKGMTLQEFLALYDKTLLERPKGDISGTSWSHEIATSWATESLSRAASSFIRVCSFLDPDAMQDSVLAKAKVQTVPQDCPADELSYIDARGELLKSSLIRMNTSATPVIIRMHRLVQDIVLAGMTILQRLEHFTFVVSVIFEAWPSTENNWDHQAVVWPFQEALLPHVFRLANITTTYDLGELTIPCKRQFISLLSSSGWYRQERGDFDSGIPLFELGIKMCTSSPSDFLDLRADISFALGDAAQATNRWPECLVHAQEQLDYRLRSDAAKGIGSTATTAIAYSELGLAQALLKQYEEGIANCDTAIDLYAKQPEVIDDSFFPAFPHFHRALACVGAGRPQDGEQGLLKLIAWHENRFGPSHTEFKLGYAWHCCGLVYARTNRSDECIGAYKKSYTNYRASVGPLYHRTGNVCGKIAEYHVSLNQFEAADFFFNEAHKAYSSQPHYEPELARHYFVQSEALRRRGDEQAALKVLQKSQELYDKVVPHNARESLSLDVLNKIVAPWVW